MRSRFNDNVPARKPRTKIGRVLTELASDPEPTPPFEAEEAVDSVPSERDPVGRPEAAEPQPDHTFPLPLESGPEADGEPEPASPRISRTPAPSRNATRPEPAAPTATRTPEPSRLVSGRERIAALRERLALSADRPEPTAEPGRTAAAVREVVGELRSRLEAAIQERLELSTALEDTRAELSRATGELERERKARQVAEGRARERAAIADEAVAEVEALAAERDQLLAEIGEQRRLEEEQSTLMAEVEATLARRDAERASEFDELAELRSTLDARAVDLADLESRLQAEVADRSRLETRCHDLEAEVGRLSEAKEALEAIEAMITRRP
jgi:hypothetical protein